MTQAVRHDLREEVGFLAVFDKAVKRTVRVVDMPDRKASLLVRLILPNSGKLAQGKRSLSSELPEGEIAEFEAGVRSAEAGEAPGSQL